MPYEELRGSFPEEGHKCLSGCGKCCVPTVWVERSEAEAICEWLCREKKFEEIERQFWSADDHPESCPFLTSEKKCFIYPVRPFVCVQFGHLEDPSGAPADVAKRVSQKCPEGVVFTEVAVGEIRSLVMEWYAKAVREGIMISEFRKAVAVGEDGAKRGFGRRP